MTAMNMGSAAADSAHGKTSSVGFSEAAASRFRQRILESRGDNSRGALATDPVV